jgi:hypothetical protein
MKSISMTTLLGAAAVLGPVMLAVLAQSEDRAMATKKCAAEICTVNNGQAGRKKVASLQQNKKAQKRLNEKSKSVQGLKTVQDAESARPSRISCDAGRSIVAKRFNRVRVIECNGGTYTYVGRRNGASFKVLVDRRTGRLVGRAPI